MVCGCIEGLVDVTSFALACPRFWQIAKPHITRIRDGLIAERLWAGNRIICGGDYQEPDDWPSSISQREYESYLSKDDWPLSWPHYDRHLITLDGFEGNSDYLRKCMEMSNLESKAHRFICSAVYDCGSFVLRNMSKKLYVFERGFDKLLEGCSEKRPDVITLGHIALAQICWSSDPTTNMCYQGSMDRGEWAGDRLEIVSKKRHKREIEEAKKSLQSGLSDHVTGITGESEWKDATDECMKLIEDIWEAAEGKNWREEFR